MGCRKLLKCSLAQQMHQRISKVISIMPLGKPWMSSLQHLDDVLIYSNSEEEHVGHVKWIMQRLLEAELYMKPDNCKFHKEPVRYLRLVISTKDISMDEDKVGTVQNWSREKKPWNGRFHYLVKVQQFLGFCNYYRLCILKYSKKAEPLTRLTKQDEPFVWELEQQLACETMVMTFTTAPPLQHFHHEREVIIETDASD